MIPCEIAGPQVDEQGDRSCQREQQAKKTVEITVIQAADDQKQGSAQKQKAGGENGLGGQEMLLSFSYSGKKGAPRFGKRVRPDGRHVSLLYSMWSLPLPSVI